MSSVAAATKPAGKYPLWMVILLIAVSASAFIDRVIVATLGPAIKADLEITDGQFGLLSGLAFALLYTSAGIPIARLADRGNRVRLLAIATSIWSLMTALSGAAATYVQLLLLRIGVGVGEAAASPCTVSLVGDTFPRSKRASALATIAMGSSLGSLIGGYGGGWLGENLGWREAFIIVGLPGFILSALLFFTLKEPPRGMFEENRRNSADAPSFRAVLAQIASRRGFLHMMIACGLCSFVNFGVLTFLPIYLGRAFTMSMTEAGLLFGLVSSFSNATGTLLGGFGSDWAAKRDERWYAWLPALCLLLALPIYAFGLLQNDWRVAMPIITVGAVLAFTFFAPTFAATQNMMEPRTRASASAVLIFFQNVVGAGLGPLFVGMMSDFLAARFYGGDAYTTVCSGASVTADPECAQAASLGIQYAMVACVFFLLWGSFHYFMASRTLKKDLV